MRLIYEGVDITDDVDIAGCTHRECAGDRCDLLEIELENSGTWFRWKPQRGDRIQAALDGYRTGSLYISAIRPEDGRFRILAAGIPGAARQKKTASYDDMRLSDLLALCASECGMDSKLYGIDGNILIPYAIRCEESAPAFMQRMLRREGAMLKAFDGKLCAVSIGYMQKQEATMRLSIAASQTGAVYTRWDDIRLAGLMLKTPFATGRAEDSAAADGAWKTDARQPVTDSAQAARWARGLLLSNNRQAERIELTVAFTPGMAAMERVDIESPTDMDGRWMVDEVEHDLWLGESRARLLRCIETIR